MLDTLDEKYFTDWYEPEVKPTMSGPYRCLYRNGDGKFVEVYSIWVGTYWTTVKHKLEDARPVRTRARHQDIRWRGLTEQGYKRLETLIEAERIERLKQENLSLLDQVRKDEEEGGVAKARAEEKYLHFLAKCDKDPRLVTRAKDRLQTSDLASLRPSLKTDDYKEYVEPADGTPDDVAQHLGAALTAANKRMQYWKTTWYNEVRLSEITDPPSEEGDWNAERETSSKGLTVSYGSDMQAKISEGMPPWAVDGSFGSKAR